MPWEVEIPDRDTVAVFPDEMSPEDARKVIIDKFYSSKMTEPMTAGEEIAVKPPPGPAMAETIPTRPTNTEVQAYNAEAGQRLGEFMEAPVVPIPEPQGEGYAAALGRFGAGIANFATSPTGMLAAAGAAIPPIRLAEGVLFGYLGAKDLLGKIETGLDAVQEMRQGQGIGALQVLKRAGTDTVPKMLETGLGVGLDLAMVSGGIKAADIMRKMPVGKLTVQPEEILPLSARAVAKGQKEAITGVSGASTEVPATLTPPKEPTATEAILTPENAAEAAAAEITPVETKTTEVPNAISIEPTKEMGVRSQGSEMGEGAPLRQSGEVAPAREVAPEAPPAPPVPASEVISPVVPGVQETAVVETKPGATTGEPSVQFEGTKFSNFSHALVSPDLEGKGWRLTVFNELTSTGEITPISHEVFPTRQEALNRAKELEYKEVMPFETRKAPTLERAKQMLTTASKFLTDARLNYIIGEPREKILSRKYPKSKMEVIQQYWDALDALDSAEKEVTPVETKKGKVPVEAKVPEPISMGPGAMTAGEPGKAQIEQLTQSLAGIEGKKVPLAQKVKEVFALGNKLSMAKDAVSRAVAGLKASGDYLRRKITSFTTVDEMLRAKGQLSAELEKRGWRVRQFIKEATKSIPSKAEQAAISKWVDAGGDAAELQRGFAETKPEFKQSYQDALNLKGDALVAAQNIRNYFEARLQEAIDAGVLDHGVEDYIHRIYENDPKGQQRALAYVQSGILSQKPALAKKRFFQFDWEAEKQGFKPVQSFIQRLAQYESSLSKAIAAREFVKKAISMKAPDSRPVIGVKGMGFPVENAKGIREATLIRPDINPKADPGTKEYRGDYVNREYPALSKWKWVASDSAGKPIIVQGDVAIHPAFVSRVDALLEPSRVRFGKYGKFLRPAMQFGSTVKQTMLDLSFFHQVQIAVHASEHRVMPWKIVQEIDFENPKVEGLLRGGVTLGGEYYSGHYGEGLIGRSITRLIPGLGPIMESYHNWLFQSFIPRVKMTMALDALERNEARYKKDLASGKMKPEDLYYLTANEANAAFGELNYVTLERNKTTQDLARLILLAPDFLEARARFAGQSMTKYGTEQRVALLLGALTMYTVARLTNKALDDQYHFEPENLFNVIYKGRSYGLRTVQGDILHLMDKPIQFWMSRLNPVYGRTMLELATGRDYFGRKRSFIEQASDTMSTAIPIALRSNRERTLMESMMNSFGVTARRWNDVDSIYKLADAWKEKNGIQEKGEFIYDSSKDPLRPLKIALSFGDEAGAVSELSKLLDSKKTNTIQLAKYFQRYATMPFTGSQMNDVKFRRSLNEDDRKTFNAAVQHRQSIHRLFLKAYSQYSAAKKTVPQE